MFNVVHARCAVWSGKPELSYSSAAVAAAVAAAAAARAAAVVVAASFLSL